MDYIKELEAFDDWLDVNPISSHARALWFGLMQIDCRAGWVTEFTTSILLIRTKTSMSKKSIIMARDELQQWGRIAWRPGVNDKFAVYQIFGLLSEKMSN